ncbi:MAG TPA: right-handed parallel beta-helix repeat-containing protein [Candidatus Babeliales bacterium]|nr:right-handed parallel beta-helix repeat-containing protein [Candidatus Babeliales bacterium]
MYNKKLFIRVALLFNVVCATSALAEQEVASSRFYEPTGSRGQTWIEEALCQLGQKIDDIDVCCEDPCASTPVTEAVILTESGIYCLANDITGTMIIAGSSITLNLNGHIIFSGSDGIAIASTASDVRIRNGFLKGSGSDRAIFINGATDVRIEDVSCESWDIGIYALDATTVSADRVMCNENCTAGMLFENSTPVLVRNSTFNDNQIGGFATGDSSVGFINCSASGQVSSDCLRQRPIDDLSAIDLFRTKKLTRTCIQSNEQVGFYCAGATVLYRDCSASNNFIGFLSEGGQTDFFNSVAESNCLGFVLESDRHTLTNCLAENNVEAGFASEPYLGEVIFRECIAKTNAVYGFLEVDIATDNAKNMYLNCVACNNGINYSPNIIAANNAPVTTSKAARGFDNIDCSLPEPPTCAAKQVSEPQTLIEPGIYCLTNDICGTICIEGSSITLDLNGYTIHGTCDNNAICVKCTDEVRIKNGRVEGSYYAHAGIDVRDSLNVRIEDVTCEGWSIGIKVKYSSQVVLERIISSDNQQGVNCKEVNGLIIRNSIFDYNCENGVYVRSNSQAELVGCSAKNEFTDQADAIAFHCADSKVLLRDCFADGYGVGFGAECSGNVQMYNCVAECNTVSGFSVDGDQIYLTNCVATKNYNGFVMPSSYDGKVTLRDCVANANEEFGFFDGTTPTDESDNMYLNCVACDNDTNYSFNIILANNAPVTSAANARGFDNIDCSDFTPDLLSHVIEVLLG